MNKNDAIRNSELYYEMNMLKQLFRIGLLTYAEYEKIRDIAVRDYENNNIAA